MTFLTCQIQRADFNTEIKSRSNAYSKGDRTNCLSNLTEIYFNIIFISRRTFFNFSLYSSLDHQNPEIICHRNTNFNVAQYVESVRERKALKNEIVQTGANKRPRTLTSRKVGRHYGDRFLAVMWFTSIITWAVRSSDFTACIIISENKLCIWIKRPLWWIQHIEYKQPTERWPNNLTANRALEFSLHSLIFPYPVNRPVFVDYECFPNCCQKHRRILH